DLSRDVGAEIERLSRSVGLVNGVARGGQKADDEIPDNHVAFDHHDRELGRGRRSVRHDAKTGARNGPITASPGFIPKAILRVPSTSVPVAREICTGSKGLLS